jgi:NADH:ubiquinone oxidoreductase subunit
MAEELPLRTRWVDYKDYELDASQLDPGWHAWISYMVDKPPTEDKIMALGVRPWEAQTPKVNLTQSWGAYRPYST